MQANLSGWQPERECFLLFDFEDLQDPKMISSFLKSSVFSFFTYSRKGLCHNYLEGEGDSKMSKVGLEVKLSHPLPQ